MSLIILVCLVVFFVNKIRAFFYAAMGFLAIAAFIGLAGFASGIIG